MDLKDYLTNEKVSKKFKSQFELVNYAISLAANMIHTGRESRVKTDSQNRSLQILTEILQDKDYLDDIIIEEEIPEQNQRYFKPLAEPVEPAEKSSERKKSRKILAE